jgi:cytochrome c553
MRVTKRVVLAAVLGLAGAVAALAAEAPSPPEWLYPSDQAGAAHVSPDPDAPKTVPGGARAYSLNQTRDLFAPPDWRPDLHPPMPDIVAHGRKPDAPACAACHLTNGQGRPENAPVSGQSAAYIKAQMEDYRNGLRRSSSRVGNRMVAIAKALTPAELDDAVRYFAGQPYRPWVTVVETETAPATRIESRVLLPVPGPREPIGRRIVETTTDVERTLLHDPTSGFVAYVPPGSIAKGRALVQTGEGRTKACAACHGADLHGSSWAPAIAGRSPSYIARQLYDFQHGARHGAAAAEMAPVVAQLTEDDLIAIGAYVGSIKP